MVKQYAPWNGAWEILTFGAFLAFLVVQAESGTVALTAIIAPLVVLAKSGSIALPTLTRPLIVLAKSEGVAMPTCLAFLVVHAEAGSATQPAIMVHLPMWTLLANAPLYRGCWRHSCNCRSLHETLWRAVHVCYRLRT